MRHRTRAEEDSRIKKEGGGDKISVRLQYKDKKRGGPSLRHLSIGDKSTEMDLREI